MITIYLIFKTYIDALLGICYIVLQTGMDNILPAAKDTQLP